MSTCLRSHLGRTAVLVTLLMSGVARASVTIPMPIAKLADYAGQVVVGRVTAVRSYWLDQPRRIESEVTLEQVEYLKGRLPDSAATVTLRVPGGEVDGYRMTICCAPELRVGEKWILFLLPTWKTHPVVGIYQGAFLVLPDEHGVPRIATRGHGHLMDVTGVGADGFVQYAPRAGDDDDLTAHVSETYRLELVKPETRAAQPITYEDFLAQLAPVLARSKDHALRGPAGQRVIEPLVPSSLKASPMQERLWRDRGKAPAEPSRGTAGVKPIPPGRKPPTPPAPLPAPAHAPTTQPASNSGEAPQ